MPSDAERLLAAEEAVRQLLGTLDRLKSEVGGYAKAATALSDARDQIAALVPQVGGLIGGTSEVVQVLGRVGTPEILARLDQVASTIESALQGLEQLQTRIEDLALTGRRQFSIIAILVVVGAASSIGALLVGIL